MVLWCTLILTVITAIWAGQPQLPANAWLLTHLHHQGSLSSAAGPGYNQETCNCVHSRQSGHVRLLYVRICPMCDAHCSCRVTGSLLACEGYLSHARQATSPVCKFDRHVNTPLNGKGAYTFLS